MVRRKVFKAGLKEKMVCHEVVGWGRAVFRHSSGASLSLPQEKTLTTVGTGGGRGKVIGGYGVSRPLVSTQERQ